MKLNDRKIKPLGIYILLGNIIYKYFGINIQGELRPSENSIISPILKIILHILKYLTCYVAERAHLPDLIFWVPQKRMSPLWSLQSCLPQIIVGVFEGINSEIFTDDRNIANLISKPWAVADLGGTSHGI